MASLNLLQWREQSLWLRYRALHCLGILLLLIVGVVSVQWVVSYEGYLNNLKHQLAEQKLALKEQSVQQQRWEQYQKQQQLQKAFTQQKHTNHEMLNAFYALLERTQHHLQQRELSLSRSQMKLTAIYWQIQQVNEQYLWLEKQLINPGLKQQLLPQQGVVFSYTSPQKNADSGAEPNG
ncbi:hypothetical protein DFO83_104199 [Idiomarina loihiensis]|jgi:hypothetical protein|uniref:hypothetical protein n=1 Tax=Idiomarina TaxID=135575 RepID=UPI0002EF1335|nr:MULTISPECIES: hypothetical protein [Idiomarina]NWO03831.1 hypothetical protein [Idiomarinaceae bacterium]PWW38499.1 hypothetical protein DFO83_104199 [Idiomarina loihiensis]TDP48427.1 hypothetical protein DET58_104104 [Idiomarina loihiensis]TDS23593.1 hypothetical protein DET62_104104 [Idiomarina sp. H2]